MTDFTSRIEADPSLLAEGIEQAEERYVQSLKQSAKDLLGSCYMNGLVLYQAHLADINERIEEAGGIKRVDTALYGTMNYIKCKDKTNIYASEILIAPPVALALPEQPQPRIPGFMPTQEGFVQLSVGGQRDIRLGAIETNYEINSMKTFERHTLTDMLEGKYAPQVVAIREGVVTRNAFDEHVAVSGMIYQVRGRVWGAKLREEFAPDPNENPEAYAAWAAQQPIPKLDIAFQASTKPVEGRYSDVDGPEFDRYSHLATYFSDVEMVPIQMEGAEKMMRFNALLDALWQDKFGTALPQYGTQQLHDPMSQTKALTS